jgi:uncharacterized peroxidase-related enzyme
MSLISTPEETDGELEEIYSKIRHNRGKIANIMNVQSLNPRALLAHHDLYVALMFGRSGLSREEREMLGVLVSALNDCDYCIRHHAEALNHYWKDTDKIVKFGNDFGSVDLSGRERVMLEYARKLTTNTDSVNEKDPEALRAEGFSDGDILNIALITAYFNFVNRIALGLGVECTDEEVRGYKP